MGKYLSPLKEILTCRNRISSLELELQQAYDDIDHLRESVTFYEAQLEAQMRQHGDGGPDTRFMVYGDPEMLDALLGRASAGSPPDPS